MVRLWWNASTGRGMFLPLGTGIVCPNCSEKLVVLSARCTLAGFTILLGGIALVMSMLIGVSERLHHLSQEEFLVVGVPAAILLTVAHYRLSPRFAHVRTPAKGEEVSYPLSKAGI